MRVIVFPDLEDVQVLPPLSPYIVTVMEPDVYDVSMYTGVSESLRNLTSGAGKPSVASLTNG